MSLGKFYKNIGDVMNFITLNEDFAGRKISFSGMEANLYIDKGMIYKIYLNSNISSIHHLMNLSLKQMDIKLTTFPNSAILSNGNLIGIRMKYFDNSIPFRQLKNLKIKLISLKDALVCLKELTDNFIYPLDLNSDGILQFNDKTEIVDLDTNTTKILDHIDNNYLNFVIKLYRNIIFELLFDDFEAIIHLNYLKEYLENKHINPALVKDIIKQNINYNDLSNFIFYYSEKTI